MKYINCLWKILMTVTVLLTMLMVANPPPSEQCEINIITDEKKHQSGTIKIPMTEFKANYTEGGHYMDTLNPVLNL